MSYRSQPNMRQIDSTQNLDCRKSSVKQDKEPNYNIIRNHISQSAPHTPVSGPMFETEGVYLKAVSRLLSEPTVSSTTRSSLSPGLKPLEGTGDVKKSPFFSDKKPDQSAKDPNLYPKDSFNNKKGSQNNNIVPVHSPKVLNHNDSITSLVKKDTKILLDMPKHLQAKSSQSNIEIVDATDL